MNRKVRSIGGGYPIDAGRRVIDDGAPGDFLRGLADPTRRTSARLLRVFGCSECMEWSRDVPAALPSPLARRWSDRENRVNMLGRLTQSTSVAQQLSEDEMKRRFLGICTAALMLPIFPFETVQASPKFALKEFMVDYHETPLRSDFLRSEIEIFKSSDVRSRRFFIRTWSSAEEFKERLDIHTKNARLIESDTLIKMYFDLAARANAITELRRKRGEGFFSSGMNDENVHAAAIHTVLDERSKAGDLKATFGSALILYEVCLTMVKNKLDAATFCKESADRLRVSSENGEPRAYVVLGMMHEEGIWYEKSNFVAAEKYFSAAQNFARLGDRDRALTFIEKATRLWPNNARFLQFLGQISK